MLIWQNYWLLHSVYSSIYKAPMRECLQWTQSHNRKDSLITLIWSWQNYWRNTQYMTINSITMCGTRPAIPFNSCAHFFWWLIGAVSSCVNELVRSWAILCGRSPKINSKKKKCGIYKLNMLIVTKKPQISDVLL